MTIHVVQPGETILDIAKTYGVTTERIVLDNELINPNQLVVGQSIVIINTGVVTYTVQESATLETIADKFGVPEMQLLRNNPQLSFGKVVDYGETIIISYDMENKRKISTNGYSYPFINEEILCKTLPFLTYITVFAYWATLEGDIIQIDDRRIIEIAKEYGVAPLMLFTSAIGYENYNNQLKNAILNDMEVQKNLIESILNNLKEKGYYGLNIDSQHVEWKDRSSYVEFIRNVTKRIKEEGFAVFVTITPETFEYQPGILYRGEEYAKIGQIVDDVMLLSYEWGRTQRSPFELPTINRIREYLDYTKIQIPIEKTSIGIPTIGYDWELPYVRDISKTNAITYKSTINLAVDVGATIQFNERLQSPYFYYVANRDKKEKMNFVQFKDARSMDVLLKLVLEYEMRGIGAWNIMFYFAQLWLIINVQFEIDKVL